MPRAVVVLPSTTYRADDFIDAAESLGVDLVVASENPPPFEMGDAYLQIDCSDPQKAADKVASLGDRAALDGVVAADDSGVVVAALAGTSLGLRANSPESAEATRDKSLMRQRLEEAEVPQPRSRVLGPGEDGSGVIDELSMPLVVKPLDRSASQGVIRADDAAELTAAVARAREIIGDAGRGRPILVEEFAPGAEIAIEGLVSSGALTVLAILDKPDTSDGPWFPETIRVPPSRLDSDTLSECERVAQASIDALGLTNGPVHIEMRVEEHRPRIIEVAARSIGGLCSRSLNFGLMGTSLEALILRNALGMEKPELKRETGASGVLMIPIPSSGTLQSVTGVDQTRAIPGITGVDLTIQPGEAVLAPPEGDRYLGFVFASAATPEDVEASLRKAMETIEVIVEQRVSSST